VTDPLTTKILGLHEAFDTADLPHAFGGALALAFCTHEPRATQDIDVNLFVGVDELDRVARSLPSAVELNRADRAAIRRDGQTRLWWDRTPVDVFLSNHPFHDHAEANRRWVPFAGIELPVLACADLAVFKAFFARLKDAVDIAAMVAAGAVDLVELRETIDALLGGDERSEFFAQVAVAVAEVGRGR
jgi:hypothetical protein